MANKILVVEDNAQNRKLLADVLRHHGYDVIEAENGEEGVRAARDMKPDLILMDLQMPVMDGYAALGICKQDLLLKDIKVIAVTSCAMKDDRGRILEAGFDDYITKPVDTRLLSATIERHLTRIPL